MHRFHLVIGSILSHAWAAAIVTKAQRLVTYFRSSHIPLGKLYEEGRRQGVTTCIETSNKTRFTSVAEMLASLLKFKLPFQSVGNGVIVKDGRVRSIIHDDQFWMNLKILSNLLQPFSQVVVAIQDKQALLADVFR